MWKNIWIWPHSFPLGSVGLLWMRAISLKAKRTGERARRVSSEDFISQKEQGWTQWFPVHDESPGRFPHQAAQLCHPGGTERSSAGWGKWLQRVQHLRRCFRSPPRVGAHTLGSKCKNQAAPAMCPKEAESQSAPLLVHLYHNCVLLQLPNAATSQVIYIFIEYLPQTS